MFDKGVFPCYNIMINYDYFIIKAIADCLSGDKQGTHICFNKQEQKRAKRYLKCVLNISPEKRITFMTRREARESALCLIYEYSYNNEKTPEEVYEQAVAVREEHPSAFAKQLYFGTCEHMPELDERIAVAADNWRIGRISRVSLAALRLCAFELLYMPGTEKEIAINEALELTRKYDDEKAVGFVNGVIGKIINT
ncbi:MAG: transcription antitermination factor NusB [Firmicutes bacterium HGW-Firmicutes-21]|nr:MAG: transcription antitermination factor NusB [Firmicutes bacterium HGW-Firmicutes-21]